jgi:hypothetical protein
VNAFFRGVLLSPGRHAVAWTYEPRRWRELVALAALALVGSIVAGVALLLRRRGGRAAGCARSDAPDPR